MRRVVLLLLAAGLVVAAAIWIARLPGAIRFEAGALTIDAATPTLVFAAIVVLAVFYGVVRLFGGLARLPRRARAARAARRRREGDAAVTRALVAIAAGHQGDAVSQAGRARRLLGDTPHTLLLAGQAHELAGREQDAATSYTALADHPDAALVGLRPLLERAIARGDWPEAAVLVGRAERAYPGAAWLREARARLEAHAASLPQLAGPAQLR